MFLSPRDVTNSEFNKYNPEASIMFLPRCFGQQQPEPNILPGQDHICFVHSCTQKTFRRKFLHTQELGHIQAPALMKLSDNQFDV